MRKFWPSNTKSNQQKKKKKMEWKGEKMKNQPQSFFQPCICIESR